MPIWLLKEELVVELKSVKTLVPEHEAQTINYLNATGIQVGLLINFGRPTLEFKRFTRSKTDAKNYKPAEKILCILCIHVEKHKNMEVQDSQGETLKHEEPTPAMIRHVLAKTQEKGAAGSQKNPVYPVHRCK